MAQNNTTPRSDDASEMQENNATGANQNEQGQASFATGSTTGGGSNFGQGSHQLGGESYRQGSTASAGANYGNEGNRLGDSSTGTSNEGSSSQYAGTAQSGRTDVQSTAANTTRGGEERSTDSGPRDQNNSSEEVPKEGKRRDTSLEEDSNLDTDNTTASRRAQSGSWSASSETGKE